MTAMKAVAPRRAKVVARKAVVKTRLSPLDRERQIIDGAIAYFAEVGFSGQTRELSKRLGITQPLLYRYFSSKQALVDRVYQTVFEGRWNPAWIDLLKDRSVPFRDRLIEFYRQGRFPFDRLIKHYDFADINQAISDSETGKTIKPVLRIGAA